MQEDDFGDMTVDVPEENEKIMKARNKYWDLCIEVYKKSWKDIKNELVQANKLYTINKTAKSDGVVIFVGCKCNLQRTQKDICWFWYTRG